jgi:signal transduction histidine kinase/DNA-binding NarL/FixJ family response regulator
MAEKSSSTALTVGSTLADLGVSTVSVDAAIPTEQIMEEFCRRADLTGVILVEAGKFFRVVSRDTLFRQFTRPFFREVFLKQPVRIYAQMWCNDTLRLPASCTIQQAAELALNRSTEQTYEPILVEFADGALGLLDIRVLLTAQCQLVGLARVVEQQRDAAEAANRAKSDFLANMSHELRTPLFAILGFTDILLMPQGTDSEAERREYLETIRTSGKHLLGLLNDVLDISKIEAGQFQVEPIDCAPYDILAEVVSLLRVRASEKGLALECFWASAIPARVKTDPARLRQMLTNLIGNAIKFTERGSVRITTRVIRNEPGAILEFEVADTGIGIPSDKLESIFQPFIQADTSMTRRFGGTGLGLSISRQLARALGGEINVRSEVGRGSVFTLSIDGGSLTGVTMLELPLAEAIKEQGRQLNAAPTKLPPARILLVDDGSTNRKVISLVLTRAGAEVVTAENGRLGVDMALTEPFDLILLDMQMPVMDGYTAARMLRDAGMRLPIIALTAHAMKGDNEKCLTAGCSGYLSKPIDRDRLLRTIELALQGTSPESLVSDSCELSQVRQRITSTLPDDDPEFCEIICEFIDKLAEKLAEMRTAIDNIDQLELRSIAHWLKGSGGTAGFPAFTQPATKMEQLALDGSRIDIEAVFDELTALAESLVRPSFLSATSATVVN